MRNVLFALLLLVVAAGAATAQTWPRNQVIVAAEYCKSMQGGACEWIPIPGPYGSASEDVSFDECLLDPTALYVRFQSSNGKWSGPFGLVYEIPLSSRGATLDSAECAVVHDGIWGPWIPTTLSLDGSITTDVCVDLEDVIYIRVKDDMGRWNMSRGKKYETPMPNSGASLAEVCYTIFDGSTSTDCVPVTPGPDGTIDIPSVCLEQGQVIYLRAKDSFGRWSSPTGRRYRYGTIAYVDYLLKYKDLSFARMDMRGVQPHPDPTDAFFSSDTIFCDAADIDSICVRFRTDKIRGNRVRQRYLPPPPVPQPVSPVCGATSQPQTVTLKWSQSSGALSYNLLVGDSTFTRIIVDRRGLSDTTAVIGPLAMWTKYFWKVQASNAGGSSAWSYSCRFTTESLPPDRPVLVSPACGAANLDSLVVFTWQTAARAETYRFQVGLTPSLSSPAIDRQGLTTTTQIGILNSGKTYYWRVQAQNTAGPSSWSAACSLSTKPMPAGYVYPGDTNDDGIVDVIDVLPIAICYENTGAARPSGSLTWGPQPIYQMWTGCHADCDGNGVVDSADVHGVIENWFAVHAALAAPEVDRLSVCSKILEAIDRGCSGRGASALRNAVLDYMQSRLGVSFAWKLDQNSPNPFEETTQVCFTIPHAAPSATLKVYDAAGRLVWESRLESPGPGPHFITWAGETASGTRASQGVYFAELAAGEYRGVIRMVRLR